MASASKSVTLGSPSGYTYTLTASFNENSTNVANNTSNVTVTATIKSNGASWSSSYNSTLIIYWHDNRENYDRQVASVNITSLGMNASRSASGTINVTHKNDGTLSGYAYAKFTKGGTSSYTPNSGFVTTNLTALTKIDRYATMTGASSFNDTQNPSFTYSNPRSLTLSAWLEINPTGDHICTRTITAGTSGTYTWELTEAEREELRSKIPNSKTATCRIGIYSTIGSSTQASYKDVTFTIIEEKPTFTTQYEDTNSTTTAITGNNQLIIRNNSTLEIDVSNATAYKSATLSSLTTELNGVIYNGTLSGGSATFDIGTLNVSENITAVVKLTDSRGFVTTKNINIQVLDWVLPTAIINLQRENNFYSETNINVNAEYSSLDNKNTISIKVRYKKVSDTTYSNYTTLQDDVTSQFTLDNNFEWNIQVLLEDRLGSTTYNLVLNRGIPIAFFDRLKRSLGINCFPEDSESLEVDGDNILTRIAGYGQGANQVTGDWNTACGDASGFYMGNGLSNSPSGATVDNWWWVVHLVHNENYQRQIAYSFLDNGETYTRIKNNGTWNAWTGASQGRTIVDYTVPSNERDHVFTNLNILPGENYKYRIVGCATANADIYLRFNGKQSHYYILGRYENGTNTTSNAELTKYAGYRPEKDGFYYAQHVSTHLTVIDGTISIKYNPEYNRYCPFFTWRTQICWSGHQVFGDSMGVYGNEDVPKITSLAFAGPTFKAGTRIQIIKVNDEFTI